MELRETTFCWVWVGPVSRSPGSAGEPLIGVRFARAVLGLDSAKCGERKCMNPAHCRRASRGQCHNGHPRPPKARGCAECSRLFQARDKKHLYNTGKPLPTRRKLRWDDMPEAVRNPPPEPEPERTRFFVQDGAIWRRSNLQPEPSLMFRKNRATPPDFWAFLVAAVATQPTGRSHT